MARLAHGHEVEAQLLQPAIQRLAEEFVEGACAFGCAMVRRRKGRRLEPSDVADYLDLNWCVTALVMVLYLQISFCSRSLGDCESADLILCKEPG